MAELQRRMDSREFSEWQAYSAFDPFGEERADYRAAIIACTIANAFRGKGQSAYKIDDFMPKFGAAAIPVAQPAWVLMAKLKTFTKEHNAYIAERKRRAGQGGSTDKQSGGPGDGANAPIPTWDEPGGPGSTRLR